MIHQRDRILWLVFHEHIEKKVFYIAFEVSYCPRCAKKLPKSLASVWSELIEKTYGITDECDNKQLKSLPQEFKTDEWWKKRGL